jgi:hypothetical protein
MPGPKRQRQGVKPDGAAPTMEKGYDPLYRITPVTPGLPISA